MYEKSMEEYMLHIACHLIDTCESQGNLLMEIKTSIGSITRGRLRKTY